MAYKFPYLARQINGEIAKNFGYAIDSVYEKDVPFIEFLQNFSIDNLSGKWLDMLGNVLGVYRPYTTIPTPPDAFLFYGPIEFPTQDDLNFMRQHGLSDVNDMEVGGQLENAINSNIFTMSETYEDGHEFTEEELAYMKMHGFSDNVNIPSDDIGVLDDVSPHRTADRFPIGDDEYRMYIKAFCKTKRKHSIAGICDVVESLLGSKNYKVSFFKATLPNYNMLTMTENHGDGYTPTQEEREYDRLHGFYDQDNIRTDEAGVFDSVLNVAPDRSSVGGIDSDVIVSIPVAFSDYKECLQFAFDGIFTTSPKVYVLVENIDSLDIH